MDYTEYEQTYCEEIEKEMCKQLSVNFDELQPEEIENIINSNLDLYREVVDKMASAHGGVYD